jgi:hypothetical protein
LDKTLKDNTPIDPTPEKSTAGESEARDTLWPASFLTEGIDYTFHAFAGTALHASRLPAENELFLWRLRNEWQLVSAMNGRDWLTLSERKRVKSHRNPAVGRQFGISRAVLRMVSSQRRFNAHSTTACGAVQHKRFFSHRLRSDLYGLADTLVAAIANQKILCKM